VTVRLDAAVTSLAFSPDGTRLAAADSGGAITRIAPSTAAVEGTVRHWSQPILWLEWSPDGGALLVATDSWTHSLAAPELGPRYSKLAAWPASSTARVAISGNVVGFAGVTEGAVVSGTIELAAAADDVGADATALVAREWNTVFALRLNDKGEPVPFDP
jgi:hypothetical protein